MSTALEILAQEFPELSPEVVENTLQDNDNDYRAAKAALQKLTAPQGSRSRLLGQEPPAEDEADDGWLSWLGLSSSTSPRGSSSGWQLGLDEVSAGLNRVGAQVALGLRQAAHTLGNYIPDDLNPFLEEEEYEYLDEEEERRRRKERERDTTGVVVSPNLARRTHPNPTNISVPRGSPLAGEMEEEEEEDLSPSAAKKWE